MCCLKAKIQTALLNKMTVTIIHSLHWSCLNLNFGGTQVFKRCFFHFLHQLIPFQYVARFARKVNEYIILSEFVELDFNYRVMLLFILRFNRNQNVLFFNVLQSHFTFEVILVVFFYVIENVARLTLKDVVSLIMEYLCLSLPGC